MYNREKPILNFFILLTALILCTVIFTFFALAILEHPLIGALIYLFLSISSIFISIVKDIRVKRDETLREIIKEHLFLFFFLTIYQAIVCGFVLLFRLDIIVAIILLIPTVITVLYFIIKRLANEQRKITNVKNTSPLLKKLSILNESIIYHEIESEFLIKRKFNDECTFYSIGVFGAFKDYVEENFSEMETLSRLAKENSDNYDIYLDKYLGISKIKSKSKHPKLEQYLFNKHRREIPIRNVIFNVTS